MEKKYQAFISSTFSDLQEERKVVLEMLIQHGFIPSGMELFPASHLPQLDFIKNMIDSCDIYLLIIGARYGTLAPSGIGYTEEEYNYAISKNKVILRFVHSNPDNFAYDKSETDPKKRELLNKFRADILQKNLCKMWSNLGELKESIAASIHLAKQNPSIVGWVRGDTPATIEVQHQLNLAKQSIYEQEHKFDQLSRLHESLKSAATALYIDSTKPARPGEYNEWEAGAKKLGQPQKLIGHIAHLGDIRIAHKDFLLPTLHGTAAVVIIIPHGTKAFYTDIGHSTLLYMDGYRVEGKVAELYSERRVE